MRWTDLAGQKAKRKCGMVNNLEWRFLSAKELPVAVMHLIEALYTTYAPVSISTRSEINLRIACCLTIQWHPNNDKCILKLMQKGRMSTVVYAFFRLGRQWCNVRSHVSFSGGSAMNDSWPGPRRQCESRLPGREPSFPVSELNNNAN